MHQDGVLQKATLLRHQIGSLALPLGSSDHEALRAAVCAYADELKRLGWPPERVIVNVKQLAREGGLAPSPWMVLTEATNPADNLLVEIVGWCIARYSVRSE
jgi:hypothetical protein